MHPHPFLAGAHPRAMAHRGWHLGPLAGAENTQAAFDRAAAEGYDYLETDAQVTADGIVVLHHDATLDRTTDGSGPIRALGVAEVRAVRVAGHPVPTLAGALAALPRARWNIDVKSDAAVGPVLEVVGAADAWDRVCLASFSEARQHRLCRLGGPRLLVATGPASVAALRVRSVLPFGLPGRGRPVGGVVQVPPGAGALRLVDRRFLAEAHRGGREVHVWTVDGAADQHRLLDLGVDGIITDRPDVLREVLDARGSWNPGRARPGR